MIATVIGTLILNTCLFVMILFLISKKVSDAEKEIGVLKKEINVLCVDLKNSSDTSKLLFQEKTAIKEELEEYYRYKACLEEIFEDVKECLQD